MATPRGNRQKDLYGGLPASASQSQQEPPSLPEINEIPPSSALRTTISSTPRNRVQNSRPTASATIEQTPSRAGSKLASASSRFLDMSSSSADHHQKFEQAALPSPTMSLLKPKRYALNSLSSHNNTTLTESSSDFLASLETPSKPTSQVKLIHTDVDLARQDIIIKSTPISKRLQSDNDTNTPLRPIQNPESSPSGGTKNEISIYKTLGWDDDIDDLL